MYPKKRRGGERGRLQAISRNSIIIFMQRLDSVSSALGNSSTILTEKFSGNFIRFQVRSFLLTNVAFLF